MKTTDRIHRLMLALVRWENHTIKNPSLKTITKCPFDLHARTIDEAVRLKRIDLLEHFRDSERIFGSKQEPKISCQKMAEFKVFQTIGHNLCATDFSPLSGMRYVPSFDARTDLDTPPPITQITVFCMWNCLVKAYVYHFHRQKLWRFLIGELGAATLSWVCNTDIFNLED